MRDHNHHNQGKGYLCNTRQTCRRVLSSVSALIAAATLVVGTTTHPVVADASPAEKAPYDASAPQVPTSPDSKKEPISPASNPEAAKVASLVAETATDFDGANTSKQADPHAKEADNSIDVVGVPHWSLTYPNPLGSKDSQPAKRRVKPWWTSSLEPPQRSAS